MAPALDTQKTQIPILQDFEPTVLWLKVARQSIGVSAVTDNRIKFLALFRSLPKTLQVEFENLLDSTADDTYDTLCTGLESRFAVPDHVKYKALHEPDPIGDREPVEYLRDLKRKYKAVGFMDLTNLRYVFAKGMPPQYTQMIYSADKRRLEEVAATIKEIWDVNSCQSSYDGQGLGVHQVHYSGDSQAGSAGNVGNVQNADLHALVKQLADQVSDMQMQLAGREHGDPPIFTSSNSRNSQIGDNWRRRSGSFNSGNSCPPLPSRASPQGLCFYHCSFGVRARKCEAGCRWRYFKVPQHNCRREDCPWNNYRRSQGN